MDTLRTNQITHFRPLKPGPEAVLMDALFDFWPSFVSEEPTSRWAATSVPIGAGQPDLVTSTYRPEIQGTGSFTIQHACLLAYLRRTTFVKESTITDKVGIRPKRLAQVLHDLATAGAVLKQESKFALSPKWRNLLPEVTSVEAKVDKWKDAALQARRNALFVHRSYVAFPEPVASRVYQDDLFQNHGIGVLAVLADGVIRTVRKASKQRPVLWQYYYLLAFMIGRSFERE